MRTRIEILVAALLLAGAAPLIAQEADGAETPAAEEAHDWEFALAATDRAPGASATVKVTAAGDASAFVVEASDLPVVDSLDQEGRDVNAYTVWIVPGKERVSESELAGVLTVGPEGSGEFAGQTPLETFGIIVTATPDGAPERIGGVPVLTGIPVRPEAPTDEADEGVVDEGEEAAEAVGEAADATADVAEDGADEAAEVVQDEPDDAP